MNRFLKSISICAALIASLSCSQEGVKAADELISANPAEINAPASMNSQTVKVEANCAWTLAIAAEDGSEVAWITPSAKAGNGNANVALKVLTNKYNRRTAVLTFKTKGGKTSIVKVTQAGESGEGPQYIEHKVRVGSFNIRVTGMAVDRGTDNEWSKRKPRVIKSIRQNNYDFFGVQEVTSEQQEYLTKELKDTYTCKFFSPYAQNGSGDKAQGLIYKTEDYTLSEWHYYWPSDTPDTMSQNDKSGDNRYNRGACCAILTHKLTGVKIFMMVMHGFLDKPTGDKYAYVNKDREQMYNPKGYPAFFVGDFNAEPSRVAYTTWTKHWKDTYVTVGAEKRVGPDGTYNNWKINQTTFSSRIDYILYKGAAEPQKYVCDMSKFDGFFPSDHFPLYADFTVRYLSE